MGFLLEKTAVITGGGRAVLSNGGCGSIGYGIARLLEPAILFNLLFLGVLASLICFVVWNVVLKQLGTIRAFNYIYLNPLFTLVGSAFLLGEQLTIVALMGAVLILGGVYWAGKK